MNRHNCSSAPYPSAARLAAQVDRSMHSGLRRAALVAVLLLMAPMAANARVETVRWTHSDPSSVAGFTIYQGLSSRNYTTATDLPPLQPDAQGIFSFGLTVPDTATVYLAVTAYDSAGLESAYSNEGIRQPISTVPGATPAPTPAATPTPEPDPAIGKPGTPYVITEPTSTGGETLTVNVLMTVSGPAANARVSNGVGPYQFLFDCAYNGTWDGVKDTTQSTSTYTCPVGTSTIKVQVWDRTTGANLHEIVQVGL